MRIRVLSDLHLEFAPLALSEVEADVLVLAGDIAPGTAGLNWARDNCFSLPVVYVAGNHEFYGGEYHETLSQLRTALPENNIYFLENEAVEIGGLHFLGCTLWTDFNLYHEANFHAKCAHRGISDFSSITLRQDDSERSLRPKDVRNFFRHSKDWLRSRLADSDPANTVVVTHSAPAWGSLANCFAGNSLTPNFVVDMEPLIKQFQPRLWVHGHTHFSFDYRIGRTQVISNPRGFAEENKTNFNPALVVEI